LEALRRIELVSRGKVFVWALRGASQHDFIGAVPELASQSQDIYLHLWGHSWDVVEKNAWAELEAIFVFLGSIGAKPLNYSEFINHGKTITTL